MVTTGYNWRMSELQAILARAQVARLDDIVAGRNRVAVIYDERLAGLEGVYGTVMGGTWHAVPLAARVRIMGHRRLPHRGASRPHTRLPADLPEHAGRRRPVRVRRPARGAGVTRRTGGIARTREQRERLFAWVYENNEWAVARGRPVLLGLRARADASVARSRRGIHRLS